MGAMVDWRTFQGPLGQDLFRQMCSDVLRALGLRVETPLKSSDAPLVLNLDEATPVRVECCPQSSDEDDRLVQKLLNRLDRLQDETVAHVVIFTNVSLSDSSKRLMRRINQSVHTPVQIACIGGRDLERLLVCQRKVYKKYFQSQPELPDDLDCSKVRSPKVFCSMTSSHRFIQQDAELRLEVANAGPSPVVLQVSAGTRNVRRVSLGTFGHQTLSIPSAELDPSQWSNVRIVAIDTPDSSLEVLDRPKPPLLPIDHIYVDPLDWRGKVRDSLRTSDVVFLTGGPGSGKSRLLREAFDSEMRPVWIDLSQGSYGQALVDHLISRVFDLDFATVRLLRENLLVSRLEELGCNQIEIEAILLYVKEDRETVGYKAFSEFLSRLASEAFSDRTLVIDNVHKLRHFDAELLRSLVTGDYPGSIVFTARDQEIEDPNVLLLLDPGKDAERVERLALDTLPTSLLIERFLEATAEDEQSLRFLSMLKQVPNMQQFMVALKSFRARGLIQLGRDGRLRVQRSTTELKIAGYRELLSDMLAALGADVDEGALVRTLEAAATFGFSFDLWFLEESLDHELDPILELLEERELITPETLQGPDRDRYRFDHELTHEIIYGSIPHFRKRRLHRQAIEFMRAPAVYREGQDDAALSKHFEVVEDFEQSANHALKSASFLVRRSGLAEGYEEYGRALNLSERLRLVSDSAATDDRSYVLEARALEGIIDVGGAISGKLAIFDQVRKLDTLRSLYPAEDHGKKRLDGRVAFYFGRHFNLDGDNKKGRDYLTRSIDLLRAAGATPELGEALSRACTLEKNCGNWDEAVRFGEEAVEELKKTDDLERLAGAYGNLGAVYLEAGDPLRTLPLWKTALDVIVGRGAGQFSCPMVVNHAYIRALVEPEEPTVEGDLRHAAQLTQRLAMEFDEARARINLANWIFFHGDDPDEAVPEMERAIELIKQNRAHYLRRLHQFSRLNLDLVRGEEKRLLERELEEMACDWVEKCGGLATTGDNRILNMVEYLARAGSDRVRRLGVGSPYDSLESYHASRPNPYRRGNRFITLY